MFVRLIKSVLYQINNNNISCITCSQDAMLYFKFYSYRKPRVSFIILRIWDLEQGQNIVFNNNFYLVGLIRFNSSIIESFRTRAKYRFNNNFHLVGLIRFNSSIIESVYTSCTAEPGICNKTTTIFVFKHIKKCKNVTKI